MAGLNGTANLNVTPLPDNDIWFANSQAWTNYWKTINLTLSFNPAATSKYVSVPFDASLQPCYQNIDGKDYVLITNEMFTSLMNRLNALEQSYQDFRTQLRAASFITNAQ